jgi:hypothetical protein
MRALSNLSFVISVAFSVVALGCGGSSSTPGSSPGPSVTGLAMADSPVASVSLKDSATPPSVLATTPDANGGFSFNVEGLTPPFFLKADAPSGAEYAMATQSGAANVNAITTVAFAAASSSKDGEGAWSGHDSHSSEHMGRVIKSLSTVLKPLFDLYGITQIGEDDEGHHLRALLHDVSFAVKSGEVTVTNRATGGVIFTGPLSNLASGTFHAENMPAGPGGTTQAACTYTYDAWGACQPDGTQTRTVLTSGPVGCTGTPVLSQSCGYVSPPPTCTSFTYSTWGTCQSNNTQTRSIATSSPAGCTGGTPVLSQACTYVPPVTVTVSNVTNSCTVCHGLTVNSTVFKAGGHTVTGRNANGWMSTMNAHASRGVVLAPGTTFQDYANFLATVP